MQQKFIILAESEGKPRVLGADISGKRVLELQAEGETPLIYKATQDVVREVKKMNIQEAIDHLEKASVLSGYSTTYPSNFREAGI